MDTVKINPHALNLEQANTEKNKQNLVTRYCIACEKAFRVRKKSRRKTCSVESCIRKRQKAYRDAHKERTYSDQVIPRAKRPRVSRESVIALWAAMDAVYDKLQEFEKRLDSFEKLLKQEPLAVKSGKRSTTIKLA